MRKPAFCICKNKDADQRLRGDREADQRLCFRYIASTIPQHATSKIQNTSVVVQPGLCRTWSETPKTLCIISNTIYIVQTITK